MKLLHIARCVAWSLLTLVGISNTGAQNFPFTSGAIPPCQTSNFTATVTGVGWLQSSWWGWGAFIESLTINITSDHPQTLSISLTSPEGTTLLLSAFNGAGGQNYTNTTFISGGNNITLASAPFTGFYSPQGGNFDVFDNENADGVWTISVQDTACANGGTGPGGTWTPGWFDGSGSGGFSFGFSSPPPCLGWIPSGSETVCTGGPSISCPTIPISTTGTNTPSAPGPVSPSTRPLRHQVLTTWMPMIPGRAVGTAPPSM